MLALQLQLLEELPTSVPRSNLIIFYEKVINIIIPCSNTALNPHRAIFCFSPDKIRSQMY